MFKNKTIALLTIATSLLSTAALADQTTPAAAPIKPAAVAATPAATQAPAPAATPVATATAASDANKAMIDQEIRSYLLAHPEILIEMSQKLQAQQQQAMVEKAGAAITANIKQLAHDPQSPIAGNLNGNVTVVEFFDYQCPHCKVMVSIMDAIQSANKNVRIVYKELPIFGQESEFAAKAALAAAKQGKYQAFHHALMKTQGRLNDQQVLDIAKSLGLDNNKLLAVMNSPAITKELQDNATLAQQLGLGGTPAFVVLSETAGKVNYRFIPGQTDQGTLQKDINEVSGVNPAAAK
jgi:protein-disulfide isomerase